MQLHYLYYGEKYQDLLIFKMKIHHEYIIRIKIVYMYRIHIKYINI